MTAATVEQFELITDDPRSQTERGAFEELADFFATAHRVKGLLTTGQAAKILGVSSGCLCNWVARGTLTGYEFAGVRMVSGAEILALHKERLGQPLPKGGRGKKNPSIADMLASASEDFA